MSSQPDRTMISPSQISPDNPSLGPLIQYYLEREIITWDEARRLVGLPPDSHRKA